MVRGTTDSRLYEVMDYDGNYRVGANGLLEYSKSRARYIIGGIMYIDDFETGITNFHYIPSQPEKELPCVAAQGNSEVIKRLESLISFSRRESTPFEAIYRISLLENSDLESFPANFFG